MKTLHMVPGLSNETNGIAVAAKLIARAQNADLTDCGNQAIDVSPYDEVWVHSMWTPQVWKACLHVLKSGKRLVRMPHGCLDPLRVKYHGFRKFMVSPVERFLFARTQRIVVTGEWEREWCERRGMNRPFEIIDLKSFFTFPGSVEAQFPHDRKIHVLFMGRRHPLKGLKFLEAAIDSVRHELRVASDVAGDAKEKVWQWCDVLVLPTLSENFGLVVAEALERGKRVITTDGAPAWEDHPGVVYLKGFRNGSDFKRIELLKNALW